MFIALLVSFDDLRAAQEQANKFPAKKNVVRSHCTADSDVHHIDSNALAFQHPNDLTDCVTESHALECLIPCQLRDVAANLPILKCNSDRKQNRELFRTLAPEKTCLSAGMPLRFGARDYMLVLRGVRVTPMMFNGAL